MVWALSYAARIVESISIAVAALAGKITIANFGAKGEISPLTLKLDGIDRWALAAIVIAVLIGFGGVTYGKRQAALKKRAVAHMSGRIKALEKMIDKERSSSNLTKDGSTPLEDQ